jgi:hypothetical protein
VSTKEFTQLERAEAQLDALIERRALEAETANREAQAWAEAPSAMTCAAQRRSGASGPSTTGA